VSGGLTVHLPVANFLKVYQPKVMKVG